MTLVKFNRNKENAVMPGVNDIFESIFNDTFFSDRMVTRVPAVNISETESHFYIELAAPGLKKEDFKLNLERNVCSISVEQSSEKQDDQIAKREDAKPVRRQIEIK
jgi:HSP20 family protein